MLYGALVIAATARLLLQCAALPPYAGLDEIHHVARLAFVLQEGRNPDIREKSMPPYLASSEAGDPRFAPSFGIAGAAWPAVVASRRVLIDRAITPADMRPYVRTNIESQQPRLYYSIAGRAGRMLSDRTQLSELRFWRLLSVLFALVCAVATASFSRRFFGPRGVAAAVLLVSLPTWLTLVVRASNDALACALVAAALAVTASAPARRAGVAGETILWALAVAAKLYTWPALIAAAILWRWQRPPRWRVAALAIGCAISMGITLADLSIRTRNPIGVLAFDPAPIGAAAQPIRYVEMLKITIASGIWTSGQHWNALTVRGMALYVLPLAALIVGGVVRSPQRRLAAIPLAGAVAFALAQVVHATGYIRRARAMGLALPAAGKEGWFWYVLAPLFVGILLPMTPIVITAAWMVGWDVIIHEGALFHDFAGTTSPAAGTWLFRWGPFHTPFSANLSHVSVGPLATHLIVLRAIHLAALGALLVLESFLQRMRQT